MASESMKEWMSAILDSTKELATGALGLDGIEIVGPCHEIPTPAGGSHISLFNGQEMVNISLSGMFGDLGILSRMFLDLEDSDVFEQADMRDAIGELVNILAGISKRRHADQLGAFNIGMPVFVNGYLMPLNGQGVISTEIRLATRPFFLSVLGGKRAAPRSGTKFDTEGRKQPLQA